MKFSAGTGLLCPWEPWAKSFATRCHVCVRDDINVASHRVGMLLHRPDWIFQAEATNTLDVAGQREMSEVLMAELPKAAVVSVGHAGMSDGFFQRVLHVEAKTASR